MISDRHRLGDAGLDALVRRVAAAAMAGVHLIQIREPDLEGEALVQLVARAVVAVRRTSTRVVVNDRTDVALAAGAHGVHLRADSVPAPRVRARVPPGFLIGRSVHTAEEAADVTAAGGLDYLVFGTVLPTASKPGHAAAGIAELRRAVDAAARLPVLAVGGITTDTVRQVQRSGCAGIAAIGLFADGPEATLPQAVTAARSAWED
jgi:thiamine-phosphate pyrophosphorylase